MRVTSVASKAKHIVTNLASNVAQEVRWADKHEVAL
jgi:hypothetical protein